MKVDITGGLVAVAVGVFSGAWIIAAAVDRNAEASQAIAVATFCELRQGFVADIDRDDCDLFAKALRAQAWSALATPDADAVDGGKDHNE